MTDIIYYFKLKGLTEWKNITACKIGSTCNIIQRMKTYITGFACFPDLTYYIINTNCYKIDDNIKKYFNYIRLKTLGSDGGCEFYDSSILTIEILEEYFINNEIIFEKKYLTNEEKNEILMNSFLTKKNNKRDLIQNEYVEDAINELNLNKRVLIKAPTGFGKTHIIYKLIAKLNLQNILILTPRLLLNKQITENKYTKYINDYEIKELNGTTENKENIIKNLSNKFILTSCYQSYNTISKLIIKYKLKINIIFDEAHYISFWSDIDNLYLENNDHVINRIFLTATPLFSSKT